MKRKKRRGKKSSVKRKHKPATSIFARARVSPRRRVDGEGFFARVSSASHPAKGTPAQWHQMGERRGSSILGDVPRVASRDLDEVRAQSVFDDLTRHAELDPALAAEIATMDPNGTYVAIFTVIGGSGKGQADDGEAERGGGSNERRIIIVGRGRRIWASAMGIAGHDGSVVNVEIREASTKGERDEAFPLWFGNTVTVSGGDVIKGTGNRALWEAQRAPHKGGRKKKSGGGMTSAQRQKKRSARRQLRARERKTEKRAAELIAKGDTKGAQRLLNRSKAARYGHSKPRKRRKK